MKLTSHSFASFVIALLFSSFLQLILLQYGDVEINPAPERLNQRIFPCCHCNANSLTFHNTAKLPQIEANRNKFDSSISAGDKKIQLDRYSLTRADHPSNTKWWGCLYMP